MVLVNVPLYVGVRCMQTEKSMKIRRGGVIDTLPYGQCVSHLFELISMTYQYRGKDTN